MDILAFYQETIHMVKIPRKSKTRAIHCETQNSRLWQHPIVLKRLKFFQCPRNNDICPRKWLSSERTPKHGSGLPWQCNRRRFKRNTCHICLKGTSLCFELVLCCADKVVLFDYCKKTDSLPGGHFILYCKTHVQECFFPSREIKMQKKSLVCEFSKMNRSSTWLLGKKESKTLGSLCTTCYFS